MVVFAIFNDVTFERKFQAPNSPVFPGLGEGSDAILFSPSAECVCRKIKTFVRGNKGTMGSADGFVLAFQNASC